MQTATEAVARSPDVTPIIDTPFPKAVMASVLCPCGPARESTSAKSLIVRSRRSPDRRAPRGRSLVLLIPFISASQENGEPRHAVGGQALVLELDGGADPFGRGAPDAGTHRLVEASPDLEPDACGTVAQLAHQ